MTKVDVEEDKCHNRFQFMFYLFFTFRVRVMLRFSSLFHSSRSATFRKARKCTYHHRSYRHHRHPYRQRVSLKDGNFEKSSDMFTRKRNDSLKWMIQTREVYGVGIQRCVFHKLSITFEIAKIAVTLFDVNVA